MCFNWEMLNTLKRSQEWTLEEIEKLANELPHLYQLTLSGGEPTLRKDLGDVIETFYRISGVKRVTIATNGYYTDRIEMIVRQVMEACPDLHLSINMSIDGIGEEHDNIRGLGGSFEKLVLTYQRVQSLREEFQNLHSATASVLTVSNKDSVWNLLDWVDENMDISTHGLMLARGDIPTDKGQSASDELFADVLLKHRKMVRNGKRIDNALADAYTESRIETVRQKRMFDPCLAGKKLIVIDELANVHPCEILKVLAVDGETDAPELGDFSFGNIRDANFDLNALLNSSRASEIKQFIADERCWCTFECAQINNFVLNPDAYLRSVSKLVRSLT